MLPGESPAGPDLHIIPSMLGSFVVIPGRAQKGEKTESPLREPLDEVAQASPRFLPQLTL